MCDQARLSSDPSTPKLILGDCILSSTRATPGKGHNQVKILQYYKMQQLKVLQNASITSTKKSNIQTIKQATTKRYNNYSIHNV